MTTLTEKDKSLASLALFSDLYDTHRNIVDVIQEFIRMSIMGTWGAIFYHLLKFMGISKRITVLPYLWLLSKRQSEKLIS